MIRLTRRLFCLVKNIPHFPAKHFRLNHYHCTSFKGPNTKSNYIKLPSTHLYCGLSHLSIIKRPYSSISIPDGIEKSKSKPTDGRLAIRFTCKVCNHINTKTMSKVAYEKGVVLIQCDGCQNRHLIADNLGWFRDSRINIEDLARENGEFIKRASSDDPLLKGIFEFDPKYSE